MKPGRKISDYPIHWTPVLMTKRLLSRGYSVQVSCNKDLWQFVATREKVKWNKTEGCSVIYVKDGRIVLPPTREI